MTENVTSLDLTPKTTVAVLRNLVREIELDPDNTDFILIVRNKENNNPVITTSVSADPMLFIGYLALAKDMFIDYYRDADV